ncbi:calcium-binding protein P [Drosophila albomicans]|uniref:Calcium-binding protein P n=1 Tax=Drosophila albomicans TaxID=7291 RepID=A0A6P8XNT3_DROAB|nr:calcium-binding protein P [Drosophila albomicans]
MHCKFIYLLLSLMVIGLTQGSSQYSRDESSEDNKTQFNLASTFSGDINSNRHHARAHLNSQLYPDVAQQPYQQPSVGYISTDIDQPSAHENGGNGLGTLGVVQPNPVSNLPTPVVGGTRPQQPVASIYPALPVPGYPAQGVPGYAALPQPPVSGYPGAFGQPQAVYPGYGYPGVYLPQYPAYPGYPGQQGWPGNIPVVTHPQGAPTSYQNQQQYQPQDHYDRSFKMNTEYKEDGVHTGPFEVLNNHNRQGYGSGYGGGYNGAYNRPGY